MVTLPLERCWLKGKKWMPLQPWLCHMIEEQFLCLPRVFSVFFRPNPMTVEEYVVFWGAVSMSKEQKRVDWMEMISVSNVLVPLYLTREDITNGGLWKVDISGGASCFLIGFLFLFSFTFHRRLHHSPYKVYAPNPCTLEVWMPLERAEHWWDLSQFSSLPLAE